MHTRIRTRVELTRAPSALQVLFADNHATLTAELGAASRRSSSSGLNRLQRGTQKTAVANRLAQSTTAPLPRRLLHG